MITTTYTVKYQGQPIAEDVDHDQAHAAIAQLYDNNGWINYGQGKDASIYRVLDDARGGHATTMQPMGQAGYMPITVYSVRACQDCGIEGPGVYTADRTLVCRDCGSLAKAQA